MIGAILSAIPGELWAALGAILAAALAWLVGRRGGVRAARVGAQNQANQDYQETTEAMQNADIGRGDPDDDTKWLSKRKDKR